MAFENAVVVNSHKEERTWIDKQKCSCGQTGSYDRLMQALILDEQKKPYDRVQVQCRACGKHEEFWFNVESFFGKPYWES